jgi:predicted regulator of Ras-like GTPase activity (Roadblock/LC7/MglB family)
MEAQNLTKLTQILNELKKVANLSGVLLSDREGNLIVENVGVKFDQAIFSSMCASVLESALGLGRTSGDQKLAKIIAELGNQSIIIMECDDKTFLALFINYKSNMKILLNKINKYINKIILSYE